MQRKIERKKVRILEQDYKFHGDSPPIQGSRDGLKNANLFIGIRIYDQKNMYLLVSRNRFMYSDFQFPLRTIVQLYSVSTSPSGSNRLRHVARITAIESTSECPRNRKSLLSRTMGGAGREGRGDFRFIHSLCATMILSVDRAALGSRPDSQTKG